jgi:hypothetical protein
MHSQEAAEVPSQPKPSSCGLGNREVPEKSTGNLARSGREKEGKKGHRLQSAV